MILTTRALSPSTSKFPTRLVAAACVLTTVIWLAGCAARGYRAPVEERTPTPVGSSTVGVTAVPATAGATSAASVATPSNSAAASPAPGTAPAAAPDGSPTRPPPGAENAGLPGHYSVKPGDTLLRIALESGQNWRDIQRWNNLDNPNVLEVGQVLRVIPPAGEAGPATARPVAPAPRIESRPLDSRAPMPPASGAPPASGPASPPAPAMPPAAVPPAASLPAPAASNLPPPVAPTATPREPEGDISWAWPATGPVTTPFDDVRSKGLVIAGKAGDPVLAAADGRVVYAGSGLRGYGNLVIVKHNATYLTAYAHNQTLLVKEDQLVRRGQKIAEMGSSDTDRVQLHFEVRRQGKPVDPAKVLPAR